MRMHSLLYVSHSLIRPGSKEMEEIASHSQLRNAQSGLTGYLFHDNGCFLQVIEGLEDDVTAVYSSIQRDPRHENVRTLRYEEIDRRAFGAWAMGIHDGPVGGPLSERFGRDLLENAGPENVPELVRFLRDLSIGRVDVYTLSSTASSEHATERD